MKRQKKPDTPKRIYQPPQPQRPISKMKEYENPNEFEKRAQAIRQEQQA